tara:strand:- start:1941 stop:2156 length:216 start_codon:yes stop_codon:yes gene_type:complete
LKLVIITVGNILIVGSLIIDSMAELTKKQKELLAKHSKHHTKKHMDSMKRQMRMGKTFTQAHMIAIKNVGK